MPIAKIISTAGTHAGRNWATYQSDKARQRGLNEAKTEITTANQNAQAYQTPYSEAGTKTLSELVSGLQSGGEFNRQPTMQDIQVDPGFQFRLDQGVKALDRSAASKGVLNSGGYGAAVTGYGQNLASQEYQSAWDRYQNSLNNRYSRLRDVAGMGQAAANNQTGLAKGYGEDLSNIALAKAASKAQHYNEYAQWNADAAKSMGQLYGGGGMSGFKGGGGKMIPMGGGSMGGSSGAQPLSSGGMIT